jgi:protein-S-isoprenylcysteine O-methyltransferase Ste14
MTRPDPRGVARWVAREVSGTAMAGILLVVTSGRWDWAMAWALVGVYAATFVAQLVLLLPRHRELLAERASRMSRDTKSWDRILLPMYGMATLALLVVAGLDMRFGWSNHLPVWVQSAGLGLALAGNGLVTWSMVANAFFAFSVRIQRERGQRVVTGGPYRVVRHPGYVGAALFALATSLLLGSLWSLVPAVISVALLVVRTSLEDRTLKTELDGYADYVRRTKYRLLPGIW